LESVPHAAPAHPLPDTPQVTPLFAGSLKTVTVMIADLLSSIVPADKETWKEIGGGGVAEPPPQPETETVMIVARSIPMSDPLFFDVMANLPFGQCKSFQGPYCSGPFRSTGYHSSRLVSCLY
jgi:hypothetical protein